MIFRLAALFLAVAPPCAAFAQDPKVPPEKDPGAVPVALVGAGIDYTNPELAKRLARDGEGNIVGWDFVDNDIHPYSTDATSNAQARQLLASPGVELVPIRIPPNENDAVVKAGAFAAFTEVRTIVVLQSTAKKEDWALFEKARQHFKDLLFVVPFRGPDVQAPAYPAALGLPNVLSVSLPEDVAATADVAFAPPAGIEPTPAAAAIALGAAIATCHAGAIGDGDPAARKAAIVAKLARPRSASKVPAIEPCP